MNFQLLKPRLQQEINRIFHEQIDYAVSCLQNAESDQEKSIHEARKSLKKNRAVLRLIRNALGSDIYKRENIFFRDLGRALAPLRDAAVWVQTLDKLEIPRVRIHSPRDELQQRYEHIREAWQQQTHNLENMITSLQNHKSRVDQWPPLGNDFETIANNIKRVYRRGRKGMQKSGNQPKDRELHDWRKRVKYLWHQMQILNPIWPQMLNTTADALHDLADLLGEDHDLVVLKQRLQTMPDVAKALPTAIETKRSGLQERARSLGKRLYAEKPAAFVERLGTYWQVWQQNEL